MSTLPSESPASTHSVPVRRPGLYEVLVLTVNGLQAGLLNRRLTQQDTAPPARRLMLWGASTALLSQICWWGAMVIGFRNSQR
ncbi:hypothetical protein [Streptomyces sp. NPDC002520]